MKNNKKPIEYTDSDESEEMDDSYLKKLEMYQAINRKMTEQAKHVPEESQEEDSEVQYAILKPSMSPDFKAEGSRKDVRSPGLPMSRSGLLMSSMRPKSAFTVNLRPMTKRIPKNDPVSRYQQMAQTWKRDKFLTGGANKKEGRKLQLQKRNKDYAK